MNAPITRRNLLASGLAMAGGIACHSALPSQHPDLALSQTPKSMPERLLGKTGISVPILGLGGAGHTPLSSSEREKDSIELIESALQLGITYFDTAASYGSSEVYLGKVLPSQRDRLLIATKTGRRDRDGAWHELERSLQRLNTDYLDVWQLHHVSFLEELDQILGKDGAIHAVQEAKEQGLIRFSGITGHHEPDVIAAGLRRYPFDTALIAVNASDIHHPRPFIRGVLPTLRELNVGAIAMKVPAYGRLFKPGGLKGMEEAMGYVLSLDGVHCCIIAAENAKQLAGNVAVARVFQPLPRDRMAAIERQTAELWQDTTFYRAWT
jgi:aryl-alcohol dehydrogenase-like predicted oxidoreductase